MDKRERPEKKVYCRNCKHHYYPNFDGSSIYEYCLLTKTIKHNELTSYTTTMTCEDARYNQKNKCEFYEKKKKWWKRWMK